MNTISLSRYLGLAVFGVMMILATMTSLVAQNTPTEEIAECIKNAWDKNVQCQTDGKKWNDILCAIKFEADVILCTFPHVPQ